MCTKKGTLSANLNIDPKELEEIMLVCHSCDDTSTKKNTFRMHKGVKHKAKLSNCDKCEYSHTKNKVPVMHKFRRYGGQEPIRKLGKLCDFTRLTTDGIRFYKMLNIQDYRVLKS